MRRCVQTFDWQCICLYSNWYGFGSTLNPVLRLLNICKRLEINWGFFFLDVITCLETELHTLCKLGEISPWAQCCRQFLNHNWHLMITLFYSTCSYTYKQKHIELIFICYNSYQYKLYYDGCFSSFFLFPHNTCICPFKFDFLSTHCITHYKAL